MPASGGHRSTGLADLHAASPSRQPIIDLGKLNRYAKFTLTRCGLLAVILFVITLITEEIRSVAPTEADIKSADGLVKDNARYITVYSKDTRRLGNFMFMLASTVGIANRNIKIPIIDSDHFHPLTDIFEIGVKTAPSGSIGKNMLEYRESYGMACRFDPSTNHLPTNYGVVLKGFYQSWKYFDGFNDVIRSHFTFKPHVITQSRDFLLSAGRMQAGSPGGVVYVAVHVRRGDQHLHWWLWFKGYTTPPKEYYEHAMDYFKRKYSNVIFIICSNDMAWSRENIKQSKEVVFSNFTNPGVDLALLSLCNHTIISVGSFGWWGAWLANGQTVYYDYWPRPGSILDKAVNKADYFLPGWIPMR